MKEVPIQDIIHMDKRISVPRGVESEITPQDPFMIWTIFSEFEKLTSMAVEGKKALDLGSGHGTALAVGESIGMKMYGLEKRKDMVGFSEENLRRAGFHPQVRHINYFSPDVAEVRFDDGTQIRDIDYFYVFAYGGRIYEEDGGHTAKIIQDFFLKDFVSPGAYLLIHPSFGKDDAWYESQSLEVIANGKEEHQDVVLKKKEKK